MKKLIFSISALLMLAWPALSFSAVRIGIGFPIVIVPSAAPLQVFQGTVMQSVPGMMVIRGADGWDHPIYLTDQTLVYGALTPGCTVSVTAYPDRGNWFAQSANVVYGSSNFPAYSYPTPPTVVLSPGYFAPRYSPGFFNLSFGFGGNRENDRHEGGHEGWGHGSHRH